MGDRPERILHSTVDLRGDWIGWKPSDPVTLLEPELPWEGAELPLETSVMGGLDRRVRELRDPCVFVDADGAAYLLYCGAGESGIGIPDSTGFELSGNSGLGRGTAGAQNSGRAIISHRIASTAAKAGMPRANHRR